jgi:hypothetical protein
VEHGGSQRGIIERLFLALEGCWHAIRATGMAGRFSIALRTALDTMLHGNKVVFTYSYNPMTRTYNWHITYTGRPAENFFVSFDGTQAEFNAFNRLVGWPTLRLDDECVLMLTLHSVQDLIYEYRSYMNIPIDYVLLRSNALDSGRQPQKRP